MKTVKFSPRLMARAIKSVTLTLTMILAVFLQSSAVTTVHLIEENFKGYSVENILLPTGQNRYAAAGTYHGTANGQPVVGYHFLYLDELGNILTSKVGSLQTQGVEARVVDIVMQDENNIWITMQVRDRSVTPNKDYIYAVKINSNGDPGSQPNKVSIQPNISQQTNYTNIYPTHSILVGGNLFICGYLSNHPAGSNGPSNVSLEKWGAIFKADLNSGLTHPPITYSIWNTPDNGFFDYDMALRMKESKFSQYGTKEILLTGANNTGAGATARSSSLLMRFDINLNTIRANGIYYTGAGGPVFPGPTVLGSYGIDIIERNNDVFMLTNFIQYNTVRSWGITWAGAGNLQTSPAATGYYGVGTGYTYNDWATQFYEDRSGGNDITVVGLTNKIHPTCSPIPYPPSTSNMNPFVAKLNLVYYHSLVGLSGGLLDYVIHESTDGTKATQLDYGGTTSGVTGTNLEDIQRLYTPAAEYTTLLGDYGFGYIAPIANRNTSPAHQNLNTKFLQMENGGLTNDCQFENMCEPGHVSLSLDNYTGPFDPQTYSIENGLTLNFDLLTLSHTIEDCNGGYFKPTSIQNTTAANLVEIYPNPASTQLNIKLGNASGEYSFQLTDITGKVVVDQKGTASINEVTIQLPQLSSGMYIATVETSGNTHTENINIK